MKSIKDIYKIGKGPSSSHTMGPGFAAKIFKDEHPDADSFRAVLYGSLAKTGIGHGTDRVLIDTFAPTPVEVEISSKDPEKLKHPNTLDLVAVKGGKEVARQRFISIGGGDIVIEGIQGVGALALDDNAVEIAYTGEKLEVSFGNAEVAGGRIDRQVPLDHLDDLRVMVDTSAIEIYANGGETVFSTRWFPTADMFKVEASFKSQKAVMYPMEDAMADAYVDSHEM